MNVTITLGGLLVGLILILRQFLPATWSLLKMKAGKKGGEHHEGTAPARFNIREHTPFLLGTTLGMLAIACPGGIIGTIAAKIVGVSNMVGDKALQSGAGGGTTSVTRHAVTAMSQYGQLITVLLVAASSSCGRSSTRRTASSSPEACGAAPRSACPPARPAYSAPFSSPPPTSSAR